LARGLPLFLGLLDKLLELGDVRLDCLKHVPRPDSDDGIRSQRPPQLRYVPLYQLRRARGRLPAPEILDQAFGGDDLAGAQEKERKKCKWLPAADLQRALTQPSLYRPQDEKPQHFGGRYLDRKLPTSRHFDFS
jgi:hypothetical protein